MLSFEQFLNCADRIYNENEFELRYGQTIMNVLYQIWPEKYKEISGGDYDCFYDDGTVRFTLEYLEKEWNNEKPI
jgi:hypothetical protein